MSGKYPTPAGNYILCSTPVVEFVLEESARGQGNAKKNPSSDQQEQEADKEEEEEEGHCPSYGTGLNSHRMLPSQPF